MKLTSWIAFLLSFIATLAACKWAMPERDVASYDWRTDLSPMRESAKQ